MLITDVKPQSNAALSITAADGTQREITVTLRINTRMEVDYYKHKPDRIQQLVLQQLLEPEVVLRSLLS